MVIKEILLYKFQLGHSAKEAFEIYVKQRSMMLLSSEMLIFGLVNFKMGFLTWKMNHVQEDPDHLMPQ